ncbi:MAG: DEAD/DEAH box helicase, partial [Leptolyngbyaceae cyanobacterium RM1_1_2]|nr:DEAD/DEAH box helicase [Leptolyngbyaceae cyanobacterium RM1_1_2]
MLGGVSTIAVRLQTWVEVLVDCPGAQGLYTYQLAADLEVSPGDILSVPFGSQQLGAIAVRLLSELPQQLRSSQIRTVDTFVAGFFSPAYWQLLERLAAYYQTPLIQVIRTALPPGLLAKSKRRVRLVLPPPTSSISLSGSAQQLLSRLQQSPTGDYSWQYLQQQSRSAYRDLQQLLQQGWVESYLATPQPPRPKQQQAVSVIVHANSVEGLTRRQQEILTVLQRQGGDCWLSEALQLCRTTSATLKGLAEKGCLAIESREVLRTTHSSGGERDRPKVLTDNQQKALEAIASLSQFAQVLLHGVTGSGKTEVYLQAIAPRLQAGYSVLVLVPEIGLTPQLTDRFQARFGHQVCVYHSALSDGERYDTWRQMLSGQPQVVIGTRSAVFAPLPKLGLIVLDEEHDSSFKQDQPMPCYHARTVARWRAELEDCPLILGSATPSLESWLQAKDIPFLPTPRPHP